jgi:hypothetical protein
MPYDFDGIDDALGLKSYDEAIFDFTIACRFTRADAAVGVTVAGFDNFGISPRDGCFYQVGGQSEAYIGGVGGAVFHNVPGPGVPSTLVIRRLGTIVDFWVNGATNGEFSEKTVGAGPFTMQNIRIGCHSSPATGNHQFFPGKIGPFGVWARAWTAAEINDFSSGVVALGAIYPDQRMYYLPLETDLRWSPWTYGNPTLAE